MAASTMVILRARTGLDEAVSLTIIMRRILLGEKIVRRRAPYYIKGVQLETAEQSSRPLASSVAGAGC